jgi:hypothetical protein
VRAAELSKEGADRASAVAVWIGNVNSVCLHYDFLVPVSGASGSERSFIIVGKLVRMLSLRGGLNESERILMQGCC